MMTIEVIEQFSWSGGMATPGEKIILATSTALQMIDRGLAREVKESAMPEKPKKKQ